MSTSNYKLGKLTEFITGEQKALTDPMNDPTTLNFKFFLDFSKKSGLLADESNVDSALAYLKRIGEIGRYELLKKWISNFKNIIENYEHLFLGIEGLDIIQNVEPEKHFGSDEDKINLKIYEPIDMKMQSLIVAYRHIVFDNVRNVEVLPTNLQRFNCAVFVFNYGYYNSLLYGDTNSGDIENLLFPTIEKLAKNEFSKMNHMLFRIEKCKIDISESGKSFLSNVNNEMNSEFVTNNFVFKFKHANYTGRFNDLFGQFDIDSYIILSTIQKNMEASIATLESNMDLPSISKTEKSNFYKLKDITKSRKVLLSNFIQEIKSDGFKKQLIKSAVSIGGTYMRSRLDLLNEGLGFVDQVDGILTNLSPTAQVKNLTNRLNAGIGINGNLNRATTNGTPPDDNIEFKEYNVYL